MPGLGVWHNGLRTEFRGDGLHPESHFIQGRVPTDRFEFAGTLGAGPSERGRDAFRRVDVRGKVAGFLADKAVGEGVIRVTLDGYDPSVLDLGQETAGVRIILSANSAINC